MIKKHKFIAFLNYIGITNEQLHAKIYKSYQKCYNKKLRRSVFEYYLKLIDCDLEEISLYVSSWQYRNEVDIKISRDFGYTEELRNEIIL